MKNRRHFLKETAMAATALAITNPMKIFAGNTYSTLAGYERNSVTILHTNDLHNELVPITHRPYVNAGGFRNTAELISSIKSENKNTVLLDSGDVFCGNINHQKEHQETMKLMRSLGYDALLPGNRDFEAGPDYFEEQSEKNDLSFIASNYRFNNSQLASLHKPYKIVQKGSVRIGVIGAGVNLEKLIPGLTYEEIEYTDPVKELNALATYLKKNKKCQLVVSLSHLGFKNKQGIDDIKLAQQSENIDVIIGGHSHTFLPAPHIVLNTRKQEVIINHAGYGGIALGHMDISFDDYGNKHGVTFRNKMIGTKNNNWVYPNRLQRELV